MKKKIVVFRFGSLVPTKSDVLAMMDKLDMHPTDGELLGCPIPNGVASLLYTDKSVAQVKQAFDEAAAENEDNLPIIILDEAGLAGTTLNAMGFEVFDEMNRVFDLEFNTATISKSCTLSLDELLDLVGQVGVGGLADAEFARLKELTNNA